MAKVTDRQLKATAMLEALGLPTSGAAALVGNFSVESGPNLPTAFRTSHLDHGSNGLAQWRDSSGAPRLTTYKRYVRSQQAALVEPGMSEAEIDKALWPWYGRLDYQTQFVVIELKKDFASLWARLRKGGDPATLAADVCWHYERPNVQLSHIAERIAYAKAIYASIPAKSATNLVPALQAAAAAQAKQKNGGIVLATMGAVGGSALGVSHAVGHLALYEWGALAAVAVVIVTGIAGYLAASAKQKEITQAATGAAVQNAVANGVAPAAVQDHADVTFADAFEAAKTMPIPPMQDGRQTAADLEPIPAKPAEPAPGTELTAEQQAQLEAAQAARQPAPKSPADLVKDRMAELAAGQKE